MTSSPSVSFFLLPFVPFSPLYYFLFHSPNLLRLLRLVIPVLGLQLFDQLHVAALRFLGSHALVDDLFPFGVFVLAL